jgi:SAM-dependent methyltransferase
LPSPYDAFSLIYEAAGFNRFGKLIGRDLARQWRKLLPADGLIADLGSGGGSAVAPFLQCGFHVVALDLSAGMLGQNPAPAVQADIRCLPLRPAFHGAICLYDTVNHLPPVDVQRFFQEVSRILLAGARFALDANTLAGARMWSGQTFAVRRRGLTVEVASTYDSRKRRVTNNVVGVAGRGPTAKVVTATVTEWYHSRRDIERAAARAGFVLQGVRELFLDDTRPETASK